MATIAELSTRATGGTRLLAFDGDVRGMLVRGRDGDKLGTIDKLVLDKRTGLVTYIVLTTGGFLGLGQSYHPIPWSTCRYDEKLDGYTVAIDRRLMEGAPSYRPDSAPVFDDAYGDRVTDYYRLPPDASPG